MLLAPRHLASHLSAVVLALLIAAPAPAVEVPEATLANRRCFNCHGQAHIGELTAAERAGMVRTDGQTPDGPARPGLHLAPDALAKGVHAGLACTQCHTDAENLPHPRNLGAIDCGACHEPAAVAFRDGVHAEALARDDPMAPSCVTCHGSHDVRKKTDRDSLTFPLNAVQLCGSCHEKHTSTNPNGSNPRDNIADYLESVHGSAVVKGGLVVAATCADCHGAHRVKPSDDPTSVAHRSNIPNTCGKCHIGIADTYADSIHGKALAENRPDAPVCTDCHTAHGISRTTTPDFVLDLVNECGTCHDKPKPNSTTGRTLYQTYRQSYHGQVTSLGSTRGARCSDCHGAHDILPPEDPRSRLHFPDNRLETCRTCHENADEGFATFHAHADFHDGRNYPLLHGVWLYFIIVMSAAFGFFGLHSVLWFGRSMYERIKHGPHPKHVRNGKGIQRFNATDRINHALVIITFFGLTLTGMPLLFADTGWGKALAGFFGGVVGAGILHRIFAIMLGFNLLVHAIGVVQRYKERDPGRTFWQWITGPKSMMPRWKDVTDCLGMIRWFFAGGSKPKFDRWTYWEKFDYWAEIGGTGIIGVSGLLLWFPEFFSQFLPGWVFNVAMIVHGYEAMLAVGFIFTIHFFNAHLRLEKFPVDDVMFTGQLPESEFKEERPAEYERLVAEGKLDKYRVDAAPKWQRPVAVIAGVIAMAIGTTIVVLIILAGLGLL